jgi:hypothetical protein
VALRDRWEYGHVVGFVFTLAGFCALVVSVLLETRKSTGAPRAAHA